MPLTEKDGTARELVDYFVLVFLHLGSPRVHVAGITTNPNAAWFVQQAHRFTTEWKSEAVRPPYLVRDWDAKFGPGFDAVMEGEGVSVIRVGPCKPNLNVCCERVIQALKQDCLDHFVVFGEAHLRHIIGEYVAHCHAERPHQGLDNRPGRSSASNGSAGC